MDDTFIVVIHILKLYQQAERMCESKGALIKERDVTKQLQVLTPSSCCIIFLIKK